MIVLVFQLGQKQFQFLCGQTLEVGLFLSVLFMLDIHLFNYDFETMLGFQRRENLILFMIKESKIFIVNQLQLLIRTIYQYLIISMRGQRQAYDSRNEGRYHQQEEMSVEEIEIALSFLKKRFTQYSLEQIMLSLTQELQKQSLNNPSQFQYFSPEGQFHRDEDQRHPVMFKTRHTQPTRDQRELREKVYSISVNNQQKLNKFEEIRLVAKFFCETGINYSLVRYFFPQMTPQQYRCYLETINNQVINEIQKFLRYECNIQIQHISTDQKRSLKGQLIKVRDWLGQKSVSQLETYYKFVERHYQQKNVEITYDQALKLYKTLLETIKSPFIDIMEVVQDHENPKMPPVGRHQENKINSVPLSSFTKEEQKRVVQIYINLLDTTKVTQKLIQLWGYHVKWNKNAIKQLLRNVLKKTLKKVSLSRDRYLKRGTPVYFNDSYQSAKIILESIETVQLRINLLKFFIANRVTTTGLSKIIAELNTFFNNDNSTSVMDLIIEEENELKIIPKVQFQSKQQAFDIVDGSQAVTNQTNPETNMQRQQLAPIAVDNEDNAEMEKLQTQANHQNEQNQVLQKLSQDTNEPKQEYQFVRNSEINFEEYIEINQ